MATKSNGEVADGVRQEVTSNEPMISLCIGLAIIGVIAGARAMRLDRSQRSAWSLEPIPSIYLFVALLLIGPYGGIFLGDLLGFVVEDHSIEATVLRALGTFATQCAICLIVFARRVVAQPALHVVGSPQWSGGRAIGLGVIAILVAWFPLQAIGSLAAFLQVLCGGVVQPLEGHTTFNLLRTSPSALLTTAMVLVATICAPLAEEFAFRGGLQRGLRGMRCGPWVAIIATSLVFAAIHIGALTEGAMASGLATLCALAIVLGWLMERTGRIAAPITAHALFNCANLILFFRA